MGKIRSLLRISVPVVLILGLAHLCSGSQSALVADGTTLGGPPTAGNARQFARTGTKEVRLDPGLVGRRLRTDYSRAEPFGWADECERVSRGATHTTARPIWARLERLTPVERKNALIELELPTGVSGEALARAESVAEAWNRGYYEHAIELFKGLGELIDIYAVAVGVSWREPVSSSGNSLWGTDVRIEPREDIRVQELDFDGPTGHLFAALSLQDGTDWLCTVNISTDGGQTWQETYTLLASYQINDVSAAVSGNHFWVCYSYNDAAGNHESARLRRHFTSDGTSDAGYGWQEIFDKDSEILDLDLSANAEDTNDRVYYSGILADGTLALFWDDTTGMSFTEVTTGVTDADRGLDSHWNQNYSTFHTWFSWITTADQVRAARWSGANFEIVFWNAGGPLTRNSSVACWGDTVLVLHEWNGASNYWIMWLVSYTGEPGTWISGPVGDTTLPSWGPHATGRMGGEFHVVYKTETGGPNNCMYTWRPYGANTWSTPVVWSDFDVSSGPFDKPRIEWVPGGEYGGIYITSGPGYCYFDRTDWFVGVAERAAPTVREFSLRQARPNPFRRNTLISFTLASPADAELSIHDVTGRTVGVLTDGSLEAGTYSFTWDGKDNLGRSVPSGLYFAKLTSGRLTGTRKLVLLR